MTHPLIIQGGMGVAVSGWTLASAVSRLGQLGVVSGTALGTILARRLQLGDPDGLLRRALAHFPFPEMAERVLKEYFVPGGKAPTAPFKSVTMPTIRCGVALVTLMVVANFVEVYLAKEGHTGLVGINYLEKIQIPTLPSLFGAMLGEVDYVLMGAGIPRSIPGAMDLLANGKAAELKIDVEEAVQGETFLSRFDPAEFCGGRAPELKRPQFLGIVASATLAITLARKSSGRVDGFVVEGDTAGGHNAPPRGPMQLSEAGEPIYGPRDAPDLSKIREIGLPFWLAGSYGRPGKLKEALDIGAAGIQVGTAFAFCEESGILPELKRRAIELSRIGEARVFTDPRVSPTGFPFKVLQMEGTLSEDRIDAKRERICDLGYLRHLYRKGDGTIGYRCPAEPFEEYARKGGLLQDAQGRGCVCNGLTGTVGLGQVRKGKTDALELELPLLTTGNDIGQVAQFVKPGSSSYTAADVIDRLLG